MFFIMVKELELRSKISRNGVNSKYGFTREEEWLYELCEAVENEMIILTLDTEKCELLNYAWMQWTYRMTI